MPIVKAYATNSKDELLQPFEYKVGQLSPNEIEIKVQYCGICYSDVSVIKNSWGNTEYPLVPGHEIAGIITEVGSQVTHLKPGDRVGLGWFSKSCMNCEQCLSGDHNLCSSNQSTILGRYGGFADKVRCDKNWAIPLPDSLDSIHAGPLFCGGITVFNPMVQFGVKPTDRAGVVGIGGLGHLAVEFLSKWGCHVTAFTSHGSKAEEAKKFGAHEIVNSRDDQEIASAANSLDYLLITANVPLNWELYINTLRPKGRINFVGAVMEPISLPIFSLLPQQKMISATPLGSPATMHQMIDFCTRHEIKPQIETYPMSEVNEAISHLKAGKARYRIVLENDF